MKLKLAIAAIIWLSLALALPVRLQPAKTVPEPAVTRETPKPVTRPASKPSAVATTTLNASQTAIKAKVEALFSDVPQMQAVVRCESRYRQFDAAGEPLISRTDDVGVMQINIPTWGPLAKELGLDIFNSVSDNILMGRIVYARQGLGAWVCKG